MQKLNMIISITTEINMENTQYIETIEKSLKIAGVYRFFTTSGERWSLIQKIIKMANWVCIMLWLNWDEILYMKENREIFLNHIISLLDIYNSNAWMNYKHITFCNFVASSANYPYTIIIYTSKTHPNTLWYIEKEEITLKTPKPPETPILKNQNNSNTNDWYIWVIQKLTNERKISIRNIRKHLKISQKASKRVFDFLLNYVCLFQVSKDNRNEKIYFPERISDIDGDFLERVIRKME